HRFGLASDDFDARRKECPAERGRILVHGDAFGSVDQSHTLWRRSFGMSQHIAGVNQVKESRLALVEYYVAHIWLMLYESGKVLIPSGEDLVFSSHRRYAVRQQCIRRSYYLGPLRDRVNAAIHLNIRRRRQHAARRRPGQQIGYPCLRVDLRTIMGVLEIRAIPEEIGEQQCNDGGIESSATYTAGASEIQECDYKDAEKQRDNDPRIWRSELERYQAKRLLNES